MTSYQSRLSVRAVVAEAIKQVPRPLSAIYDVVRCLRPETAKETIRARVYEGVERGEFARIAPGIYYARRGEGQLLVVHDDAWNVLRALDDDSVDALVTDPPGKFGRTWAGTGTTRPHSDLGGRTYDQPEIDSEFLKQAFRVLKKKRPEGPHASSASLLRIGPHGLTSRTSSG